MPESISNFKNVCTGQNVENSTKYIQNIACNKNKNARFRTHNGVTKVSLQL